MQFFLPGLEPRSLAAPSTDRLLELGAFPNVSAAALTRHAVAIGKSGEKLVDSLLLRAGEQVFEAPEGMAYDRIILRPEAVLRLQVKTCSLPRAGGYSFEMLRRFHGSAAGTRRYLLGEYHIAALVCLDQNVIFFASSQRPRHRIPLRQVPHLRANPFASWHQALADLGLARPRQDDPAGSAEAPGAAA